jgi:NADP-dependent 3-hydroxy acid dehydrogenase YdfG
MTDPIGGAAVLITGASGGSGAATARRFAELGAIVAAVARRKHRLDALIHEITTHGGRAVPIEADIGKRNEASAAVQRAFDELGRIDVLVNNAGQMLLMVTRPAHVAVNGLWIGPIEQIWRTTGAYRLFATLCFDHVA